MAFLPTNKSDDGEWMTDSASRSLPPSAVSVPSPTADDALFTSPVVYRSIAVAPAPSMMAHMPSMAPSGMSSHMSSHTSFFPSSSSFAASASVDAPAVPPTLPEFGTEHSTMLSSSSSPSTLFNAMTAAVSGTDAIVNEKKFKIKCFSTIDNERVEYVCRAFVVPSANGKLAIELQKRNRAAPCAWSKVVAQLTARLADAGVLDCVDEVVSQKTAPSMAPLPVPACLLADVPPAPKVSAEETMEPWHNMLESRCPATQRDAASCLVSMSEDAAHQTTMVEAGTVERLASAAADAADAHVRCAATTAIANIVTSVPASLLTPKLLGDVCPKLVRALAATSDAMEQQKVSGIDTTVFPATYGPGSSVTTPKSSSLATSTAAGTLSSAAVANLQLWRECARVLAALAGKDTGALVPDIVSACPAPSLCALRTAATLPDAALQFHAGNAMRRLCPAH